MQLFFMFFLLWVTAIGYSQDTTYPFSDIPKELLESANSVVRYEKKSVHVVDRHKMKVASLRVITVLNDKGNVDIKAWAHYDPVTKVEKIVAKVLDASGKVLKTFKQKDFIDRSAVDGISLFTDSRLLLMNYVPIKYPYTVVFEMETETENTAFIDSWFLNGGHHISTQESVFEITSLPELGLKYKIYDPKKKFTILEKTSSLKLTAKNIPATVSEIYAPPYSEIAANARFAIDKFHLEGVDGEASDWNTFGRWMNNNLLQEAKDLNQQTKYEILKLTEGLEIKEKARVVYEYMQKKTRYISVQVGIGGWKPMLASEVDALSYGDCKALTNYTQALLDVVGVPSYYTIVYAGNDKKDITSDFTAMQGNHAFLTVPIDNELVSLECTSQKIPFGFSGDFTDDRDVLLVTPEGGKIVHTKSYDYASNLLDTQGGFTISEKGTIAGDVMIASSGLIYDERYVIENLIKEDQKKFYKKSWKYIPNLAITSLTVLSNKREISLKEKVSIAAENYVSFAGDDMLIQLNVVNRWDDVPRRDSNRQNDVVIPRGRTELSLIRLSIPEQYAINELPDNVVIKNKFGSYSCSLKKISSLEIEYNRKFEFKGGNYSKDAYSELREFLKEVARSDTQRIVLSKKL